MTRNDSSRLGRLLAAASLGLAAMSIGAPSAAGACGHTGGFADYVAPNAETIVLGRVEAIERAAAPSPSWMEPQASEIAIVRTLRVFKGSAEAIIEVDSEVLGDCTYSTSIGERIVLAFVHDSRDGSYVGSWHEDPQGTWWHHVDSYRNLRLLLTALGVPPDTATDAQPPPAGEHGTSAFALAAVFAGSAMVALLLAWRRPIRSRQLS